MELTADVGRAVRQHARETYPQEACGLLLGPVDTSGGCSSVTGALRAVNAAAGDAEHRYSIEPDFFRGISCRAVPGEDIVGVYHSHPEGPPRPSPADEEQAWPWYVYVIIGRRGDRAMEMAAFELEASTRRFRPVGLLEPGAVPRSALDTTSEVG